jgi:hypothetical protein
MAACSIAVGLRRVRNVVEGRAGRERLRLLVRLPRERPPLVRRRRVDRVVSDAPIRAHARVVPHAERYLRKSGVIGLEVEATGKLFTRNIWLKKLN